MERSRADSRGTKKNPRLAAAFDAWERHGPVRDEGRVFQRERRAGVSLREDRRRGRLWAARTRPSRSRGRIRSAPVASVRPGHSPRAGLLALDDRV